MIDDLIKQVNSKLSNDLNPVWNNEATEWQNMYTTWNGFTLNYLTTNDPNKSNDYVIFNIEIFDKSYARYDGQVIINIRAKHEMAMIVMQEVIINSLDNYTYANEKSSANFNFTILNDISKLDKNIFEKQIIFEFMAR